MIDLSHTKTIAKFILYSTYPLNDTVSYKKTNKQKKKKKKKNTFRHIMKRFGAFKQVIRANVFEMTL